jgi:ribonuclease HI
MTNEIEFYVDGSAINNENPNVRTLGGIGVYIHTNSENGINILNYQKDRRFAINVDDNAVARLRFAWADYPLDLGKVTNNTTELAAIYYSLVLIKHQHKYDNCTIYGDSQYAGNLVFGNWKPKQNKELVAKVKGLAKTVPHVKWEYVKAHDGNVYNEYADYLAKTGAYNQTPLPFNEWKETEF